MMVPNYAFVPVEVPAEDDDGRQTRELLTEVITDCAAGQMTQPMLYALHRLLDALLALGHGGSKRYCPRLLESAEVPAIAAASFYGNRGAVLLLWRRVSAADVKPVSIVVQLGHAINAPLAMNLTTGMSMLFTPGTDNRYQLSGLGADPVAISVNV